MRLKLGLSQAQFAEELGIGVPRLSSYEYGRAGSIPEWVMTAARELAANNGEAQESNRKKYEGLEMPAILAGWAKALGVPYEDNGQLAALLGTSVSTLTRWKNKLTRPSLHSLAFHEHMVDQAQAETGQTEGMHRRTGWRKSKASVNVTYQSIVG